MQTATGRRDRQYPHQLRRILSDLGALWAGEIDCADLSFAAAVYADETSLLARPRD